jgi:hypothetical protein
MSPERLSLLEIKHAFMTDNSYSSQEAHCAAYKRMFSMINLFDELEYLNLGASGCSGEG